MTDDMVQGYLDGFRPDAIEPGENRSEAYRHGWLNARDDRRGKPRATAEYLRREARRISDDR